MSTMDIFLYFLDPVGCLSPTMTQTKSPQLVNVMVWPLLFPFLSLSSSPPLFPFISNPIQFHPLTLHLLPCQLQGILIQPCYAHYQTSLRLVPDPLRPSSHATGYCLYTFHTFI